MRIALEHTCPSVESMSQIDLPLLSFPATAKDPSENALGRAWSGIPRMRFGGRREPNGLDDAVGPESSDAAVWVHAEAKVSVGSSDDGGW
jgi:hypothetical protein